MGKYTAKFLVWIAFLCVLLSLHYVVSDILLWDFVPTTKFTLFYIINLWKKSIFMVSKQVSEYFLQNSDQKIIFPYYFIWYSFSIILFNIISNLLYIISHIFLYHLNLFWSQYAAILMYVLTFLTVP